MDNSIQFCSRPAAVLLHSLEFRLVRRFEHAIACYVVTFPVNVFLDTVQHFPLVDAARLQEGDQVVNAEVSVGASVTLTRTGRMLRQDLLTREG